MRHVLSADGHECFSRVLSEMLKCRTCKGMFEPTDPHHPRTCPSCLATPDGYPVVQGSLCVRMVSRKRFETERPCRHCKKPFLPWAPGKVSLCRECSEIPKKELRSIVNARARAKKLNQKSTIPEALNPKAGSETICQSKLEGIDRGILAGFKQYMLVRPHFFQHLFRVKCTESNIKEVYRNLK